jgi:hypothetical protein
MNIRLVNLALFRVLWQHTRRAYFGSLSLRKVDSP